jgi:mono/diheme cytochrome c family protein
VITGEVVMDFARLLVSVLVAVATSSAAFAQSAGDPQRGKAYSQKYCSDCHAVTPDGGKSPDAKAPPFTVAANTKGMTAMALSVWLQTGHPTMPNIRLRPETASDIIAYILSLRDPPE